MIIMAMRIDRRVKKHIAQVVPEKEAVRCRCGWYAMGATEEELMKEHNRHATGEDKDDMRII